MMSITKLFGSAISVVAAGDTAWHTAYDYLFKMLMIGDSLSGKSQTLTRYTDGTFDEIYRCTIGVDFKFRVPTVDRKVCKIQVWDSAGQERFGTITESYYRGSHAILLFFDLTDKESFENMQAKWLENVKTYANENVVKVIVGNKLDLTACYTDARSLAVVSGLDFRSLAKLTDGKKRPGKHGLLNMNRAILQLVFSFLMEVSYEEADAFAGSIESSYFETSAKDNINIDEVFEDAVRRLLKNKSLLRAQEKHAREIRRMLKNESRTRSFFRSFGNLFKKRVEVRKPIAHYVCGKDKWAIGMDGNNVLAAVHHDGSKFELLRNGPLQDLKIPLTTTSSQPVPSLGQLRVANSKKASLHPKS